MRWRVALMVALVAIALLSATRAGEEATKASEARRIALEDELRVLLKDHGPTHPDVVNLKQRIAALSTDIPRDKEIFPKGLLVVLSKGTGGVTLKTARIRSLGSREFIVGVEVEGSTSIKPTFVGKTVWIPLDEVTQLVEWDEPKEK